jgi:hypothetical protein
LIGARAQSLSAARRAGQCGASCSNFLSAAINISRDSRAAFARRPPKAGASARLDPTARDSFTLAGSARARRRLLHRRRWRIFQCHSLDARGNRAGAERRTIFQSCPYEF